MSISDTPHPADNHAATPYRSTWRDLLPDDEIARQQDIKSRLQPGMEVEIRGLGRFTYSGLWDTMHAFYPAAGQDLSGIPSDTLHPRYIRRDLRGRHYLHLPYTLLADYLLL